MSLIIEGAKRLRETFKSQKTKEQDAAFRKIETSGAVNSLIEQAELLRKQGDTTAIVVESRDNLTGQVWVQLLYHGQRRRYLGRSWWDAKGIAVTAFNDSTNLDVMFTTGNSWGSADRFSDIKQADSLVDKLSFVKRFASLQDDFRYGEGDSSRDGKLRGCRLIYPTK